MKLAAVLLLLAGAAGLAAASHHLPSISRLSNRHGHLSRAARKDQTLNKRCKSRSHRKAKSKSHGASSGNDYSGGSDTSTGPTSGVINVPSSCGPIGATTDVTPTTGPNGAIDWLNCGVDDGGWRPPFVRVSDIVAKNLSEAILEDGSPFRACDTYIDVFERYAAQYGVPAILIAAIAMQESSCNPSTEGGGGEQGLMQITPDKCGGAPGGDCKDPDFNIRTGVKYFSETLLSNGDSLLLTIGNYNGWPLGMTYDDATAAGDTSCCTCQNNLDYLQQTLNGWVQNVNPYSSNPPIGKYFNLNKCY